jgi:hypothetical protein
MKVYTRHDAPLDGPMDVAINPQHLRSDVIETRRQQYGQFLLIRQSSFVRQLGLLFRLT